MNHVASAASADTRGSTVMSPLSEIGQLRRARCVVADSCGACNRAKSNKSVS
jgi:hypothetical protein